MIDKQKRRDLESVALMFLFLPAVVVAIAKFLYSSRKDLTMPNKDMWE